MEVLEIRGKRLVKASVAARKAGYTSDYVGQLCRSGAVDAELVGRSWYVDAEQLAAHRVEKKRNSRVKAREQVKKALQEREKELPDSLVEQVPPYLRHFMNAKDVAYGADERELIPRIDKQSQEPQKVTVPEPEPQPEPEPALTQPAVIEETRSSDETAVAEPSPDTAAYAQIEIRRPEPIATRNVYTPSRVQPSRLSIETIKHAPKKYTKAKKIRTRRTSRLRKLLLPLTVLILVMGMGGLFWYGEAAIMLEKMDAQIKVTTGYRIDVAETKQDMRTVWDKLSPAE